VAIEVVKTMHPRFLLLAALAVSTSACASSDELQAGMERYKNEPVNELVARLGPASSTAPDADGPLWVWSTGDSLTGSALNCALRVRVGDDQRVIAADWSGNYGACRYVSQRLQGQH
jgi:hypothetical protein